jgi:hypothetical protein
MALGPMGKTATKLSNLKYVYNQAAIDYCELETTTAIR